MNSYGLFWLGFSAYLISMFLSPGPSLVLKSFSWFIAYIAMEVARYERP